jgi:hypothetical protein
MSAEARDAPVIGAGPAGGIAGGAGTQPAERNVLLVGDAAGLVNPLQGEGIAPPIVSGCLAAEAVIADPTHAGEAYAEALADRFGRHLAGAAAVPTALVERSRLTSAGAGCSPSRRCAGSLPAPGRYTGTAWWRCPAHSWGATLASAS